MPTTKSRINITAEPVIEVALRRAAKHDSVPVATKAAELIALGLELEEDISLAQLADTRSLAAKKEYIPHDRAWLSA